MHLAAYYIYHNEFGIKNQTINFGGKYFYTLCEVENRKIKVSRILNEKYIHCFYDDKGKLTQVSAIVGRNGTGKTTLIKSVINQLNSYLKNKSNYFVFEDENEILLVNSEKNTITNLDDFEIEKGITLKNTKIGVSSIYYSPHLDFKEEIGDIDISLDKILTDDLDDYTNLNHHASFVNPIKQNEFNNFKRQLEMQEFKKINEALTKSFGLPKPKKIRW